MADFADEAIDAMLASFPAHRPGTRPIHSNGITTSGWFEASSVAAGYSEAAHFDGRRVPVTVRFSNGTGNYGQPDSVPAIRGMAVRFHLGEGPSGPVETDMVCMTQSLFWIKTPDRFLELVKAAAAADPPRSRWRTLVDALNLRPPQAPGSAGLLAFARDYPPARLGVAVGATAYVPESFVTSTYHAVHAYKLVAGSNVCWARFRWEPASGIRPAPPDVEPFFLHEELRERLARGPAELVLRIQVADAGDDTSDPTTPWPATRKQVVMGSLWIEDVVPPVDGVDVGERFGFDPTRVVPGVELSDDPILRVRREVYARSRQRRLGGDQGPPP